MRTTTKCLFLMALVAGPFFSNAQQRPYYTQYVLNPFVSNPALAGIENYWDVRVSYRNQWTGISGSPQTIYVTANGPFRLESQGPKVTSRVQTRSQKITSGRNTRSASPASHGGGGITVVSDKAGPVEINSVNAAYAYHVTLTSKTSLSAGVGLGMQSVRVRADQLDFGTANPSDPAVNSAVAASTIKPDMSVGLWLYSSFYFVGVAAQNIIPVSVPYSETTDQNGRLLTHSSFVAGYKFYLSENANFIPSAMIRYTRNAPFNFDINTKFTFHDIAWLGLSYRHSQNFAAIAGMNISSSLSFGYSYDMTTSRLKSQSNGSHEVVIGIFLGRRSRVVLTPRNFW